MNDYLKVCYTKRLNFGDLLNPLIFERVLSHKIVLANEYNSDITGIGSGLRRFVKPKGYMYRSVSSAFNYALAQLYRHPLIIWSAGFTYYPQGDEILIRPNVKIASVRGQLTKKRLSNIVGHPLDITTGDGGLLAGELLTKRSVKNYHLGIIPHISERKELFYQELNHKIKDSILIDVQDDPLDIIKLIDQCECVISSSLHGLIVADSLNIPNVRVKLTDRLVGDGYKFDDYYSSFDLDSIFLDLKADIVNVDRIINDYRLKQNIIDDKKKEIIKAFNRYL